MICFFFDPPFFGFAPLLALGALGFFDPDFLLDDALEFFLAGLAGVSGFAGEVVAGAGVVAAGAGVAAGVSALALGCLLVVFGLAAFGLGVLGLADLDLELD